MNNNGGILALVVGFLFAGYLLVYAAVANGGKLAATPWRALVEDAYTGQSPTSSSSSSGKSGWGLVGNWISRLKPEKIPPADIHAIVHREVK